MLLSVGEAEMRDTCRIWEADLFLTSLFAVPGSASSDSHCPGESMKDTVERSSAKRSSRAGATVDAVARVVVEVAAVGLLVVLLVVQEVQES